MKKQKPIVMVVAGFTITSIFLITIIATNLPPTPPTPREYAMSWPRCYPVETHDVCLVSATLPCTPTGWVHAESFDGDTVCSPPRMVWECPFVSFPYDDGHIESLACYHGFDWLIRDAVGPGWHTESKGPWKCSLRLFTYMDPRKWGQ